MPNKSHKQKHISIKNQEVSSNIQYWLAPPLFGDIENCFRSPVLTNGFDIIIMFIFYFLLRRGVKSAAPNY